MNSGVSLSLVYKKNAILGPIFAKVQGKNVIKEEWAFHRKSAFSISALLPVGRLNSSDVK
jgi:hypothetical protein